MQIVQIAECTHISLSELHSPDFSNHLTSMWLVNCPECHETVQWDQLNTDVNVCLL